MNGIMENEYILGQSSPGTVTPGGEADINLTLEPSISTPQPPQKPQPSQNATIQGTVTTATKVPVANAYVKLMSLNYEPLMHAVTNLSGEYILKDVPQGYYYLASIAPGMQLNQIGPVEIKNLAEYTENFILTPDPNSALGIIVGKVTNTNGQAIDNALVTLSLTSAPNNIVAVTYTNSQGNYMFTEVTPGNYNVNVSANGYIASEASATVTAGQITSVNEQLSGAPAISGGTISGVISDNTGAPVVGANVILYSKNTETNALTPIKFTTSGANGVYLFTGVGAGTYVIKANKIKA